MKRTIYIIILLSVICVNIFSQTDKKFNVSEKQAFEQKLVEHSKQIKTLQCSFTQEKTSTLMSEKAVAKGILMYQFPNMLRWEYFKPTPSTLIINGNNAALLDKNGKRLGNEGMLKQIGGIIISMISGDGLGKNKQFTSEIFDAGSNEIQIVLTPVQKRMKDFFSNIELKIDAKTLLANEIVLNEISGDKTVILLTSKELNKEILSDNFAIK